MSNLYLTHAEDPDGILAHALFLRAERIIEPDPRNHFFARYDVLGEVVATVLARADEIYPAHVHVADISINRELKGDGLEFPVLRKLAGSSGDIHWFDHHEGTREVHDQLQRLGITTYDAKRECAARLVRREMLAGDVYASFLADIAQAHDYRDNVRRRMKNSSFVCELGDKLQAIISQANADDNFAELLQLAADLSQGDFFWRRKETILTDHWEGRVADYERRAAAAKRKLEDTITEREVHGIRVLFGYADPILSQKPGPRYLKEQFGDRAEVIVTVFAPPFRKVIVDRARSLSHSFYLQKMLTDLGGGGRNNGGGYSLVVPLSFQEYRQFVEETVETILQYIHKD